MHTFYLQLLEQERRIDAEVKVLNDMISELEAKKKPLEAAFVHITPLIHHYKKILNIKTEPETEQPKQSYTVPAKKRDEDMDKAVQTVIEYLNKMDIGQEILASDMLKLFHRDIDKKNLLKIRNTLTFEGYLMRVNVGEYRRIKAIPFDLKLDIKI